MESRETKRAPATGPAAEKVRILTTGEHFPNGGVIQPIRRESGALALLHWNGRESTIATEIQHENHLYMPADLDPSISDVLRFPRASTPFGTTKKLFGEIASLIATYTGLPANFTAAATFFALATWFTPSPQVSPWLSINGRDSAVADQLLQLLRCFCRRALLLTDVTVSSVCSLPLQWDFTLMFLQNSPSPGFERLLHAARQRHAHMVHGGRLIRPFGPIVTCSSLPVTFSGQSPMAIEIPALPSNVSLPILSPECEMCIADEFQSKLLAYFLENFQKVVSSNVDASALDPSIRETGRSLMACAGEDLELQEQVIRVLKNQHESMRSSNWTDPEMVLIEALLFFLHEGKKEAVYVGEVGKTATKIVTGRGETLKLEPKNVATRLRLLGLKIEPRDARGYRLLLTKAFSRQVHELAVRFDAPTIQVPVAQCQICREAGTDPEPSNVPDSNVQIV